MRTLGTATLLILAMTSLATSCKSQPEKSEPIEPKPSAPVVVVDNNEVVSQIKSLVVSSTIANYSWKNRGKSSIGYLKGMALVYARSVCNPSPTVSKESWGSKDALEAYNIKPSNKNTYAFLIGLGMRESSGRYCEGVDQSATNHAANTAEAGMFQTSYNSSSSSSELAPLLKDYPRRCYLEEFKEQTKPCTDAQLKNWGDSNSTGYLFQKTVKTCPAFAAEYAAITIRVLSNHYGPINRKEVEFKQEVVDLLTSIETLVKNNPTVCSVL